MQQTLERRYLCIGYLNRTAIRKEFSDQSRHACYVPVYWQTHLLFIVIPANTQKTNIYPVGLFALNLSPALLGLGIRLQQRNTSGAEQP